MNLAPVTEWLVERIGLDTASLGPRTFARIVIARMRALALTLPREYAARLESDPREFQALIADLTVSETWFFRGGDVFAYLTGQVVSLLSARPESSVRILSVPCSTGEEPYSLAIALIEAGVPAERWTIDGVDLCARAITLAREGRFGDFSFRQTAPGLRQRHFHPIDGRWELNTGIRSLVRFRTGNLLDSHFLAGEKPFDLVFCRNLFIYLQQSARRQALGNLAALLAPQGLLCAGPAEPLEDIDNRFQRTGPTGLFLYQRVPDRQKDPNGESQRGRRPLTAPWRAKPARSTTRPTSSTLPAREVLAAPSPDLLARARQQADAGQLEEALAACEAIRNAEGPTADLFSLIGIIYQARHHADEAARSFRSALYLDPAHREALTHWLLLCKEQGNHAQAARLKGRLNRIAPED
jgi:chemotaxis protein methyltransferase WspC